MASGVRRKLRLAQRIGRKRGLTRQAGVESAIVARTAGAGLGASVSSGTFKRVPEESADDGLSEGSPRFARLEQARRAARTVDREPTLVEAVRKFRHRLPGDEKFQIGEWNTIETGAPLLKTAVVAFDCRVSAMFEVATHVVLIGEIVGLELGDDAAPLLYGDGNYGAFTIREALAAAVVS